MIIIPLLQECRGVFISTCVLVLHLACSHKYFMPYIEYTCSCALYFTWVHTCIIVSACSLRRLAFVHVCVCDSVLLAEPCL